jgi:hypothetical protein
MRLIIYIISAVVLLAGFEAKALKQSSNNLEEDWINLSDKLNKSDLQNIIANLNRKVSEKLKVSQNHLLIESIKLLLDSYWDKTLDSFYNQLKYKIFLGKNGKIYVMPSTKRVHWFMG